MAAFILVLLLFWGGIGQGESEFGVNWGTLSQYRLPANTIVGLLQQNKITKVKLFDAEPTVLNALRGSGIQVMLGIPNYLLQGLSSSLHSAEIWVRRNLSKYISGKHPVDIRYVAVGNEPFLMSYSGQFQNVVVPALLNLNHSLVKAKMGGSVKLVVPCNADAYQGLVPSQGAFRPELTETMMELLSFLNAIESPFVANIYPFFPLNSDPNFPQDYAFFQGTNHPLVDGENVYNNAFDGNLDTLVAALSRIGYGQMPIIIGETGWPTDGAPGASLAAARSYNQGLVDHIRSNKGTPLRPGIPPEDVYFFGLIDEGAKSTDPGSFERHWGLFFFNGQAKYDIDLGLGNGLLVGAKDVAHLPARWCVANPIKDFSEMVNHTNLACTVADCSSLSSGGSCSVLGESSKVSYAFNNFYQLQRQASESCFFDGFGSITFDDPSIDQCRFIVGIADSGVSSFYTHIRGDKNLLILLEFVLVFLIL